MIARDALGRDVSAMARQYKGGLIQQSFMGGDPNVIAALVAAGMSQTDANFIADYAGVDKPTLLGLIQGGIGPYNALTQIYGGNFYLPNVDATPLPGYKHPTYVPPVATYKAMLAAGKSQAEILAAAGSVSIPPPSTGTNTSNPPPASGNSGTPAPASGLPFGIPSTIGGIPTIYIAGGAIAAFLLSSK